MPPNQSPKPLRNKINSDFGKWLYKKLEKFNEVDLNIEIDFFLQTVLLVIQ